MLFSSQLLAVGHRLSAVGFINLADS